MKNVRTLQVTSVMALALFIVSSSYADTATTTPSGQTKPVPHSSDAYGSMSQTEASKTMQSIDQEKLKVEQDYKAKQMQDQKKKADDQAAKAKESSNSMKPIEVNPNKPGQDMHTSPAPAKPATAETQPSSTDRGLIIESDSSTTTDSKSSKPKEEKSWWEW